MQVQNVLVRGGPTPTPTFFCCCFFKADQGREDQNITKSRPLMVCRERPLNDLSLAGFRWRADDGPTLNAGLVFQGIQTSIAKKPYTFVIFQGWGSPDPPVPPLDPGMIH